MPIGEDNIMVTIIIYAYNAEERLEQCVESVLSQTYTDFEIIIVDDGSSDMTAIKALQMADEDDRIQVYGLIKRIGPANAKNNGIYNASGNYILFLDSTDCLEQNALQIMVSTAKSHDADLVIGNFKYCQKGQPDIINNDFILEHKIYIEDNISECVCITGISGNKLWKSSMIGRYNIRFQDKCLGEDMVFYHYGLSRCKKVVTISDFVLQYRLSEKIGILSYCQDSVREPFDLIRINYEKTQKQEYIHKVIYNEFIYRINGIKNIPLYKDGKFRIFLFRLLTRSIPHMPHTDVNEEREIQDRQKVDHESSSSGLTPRVNTNPSSRSGYEQEQQIIKIEELAKEYEKISKKKFFYTSAISSLIYRHLKRTARKEKGDVYFGKYYNPGV